MTSTAPLSSLDRPSESTEGFKGVIKDVSPAYWFTMFAASALGTNLGDFWVDGLSLSRAASFASLVVVCVVALVLDRRWGARTEIGFWIAIVVLRAAATNCADYLTHDLHASYSVVTIILGFATLGAAMMTTTDPSRRGAPVINIGFWATMLLAGLFGTTGGDLASHSLGLGIAAITLSVLLVALIAARRAFVPSMFLGYWVVLLAERTAATPAGDWLASRHGAGLGLPIAMLCTGALLATGLITRNAIRETLRSRVRP